MEKAKLMERFEKFWDESNVELDRFAREHRGEDVLVGFKKAHKILAVHVMQLENDVTGERNEWKGGSK